MSPEQPGQRQPDGLSDLTPETLFEENPEELARTHTRQQLLANAREFTSQAEAMQPDIDEAQRVLDALKAQREFINGRASRHIAAAEIAHSNDSGE